MIVTRKKEKNLAFLLVKLALGSSEGKWGKGEEEKVPHQNGPSFHAKSGGLGASPSFGGSASRRGASRPPRSPGPPIEGLVLSQASPKGGLVLSYVELS